MKSHLSALWGFIREYWFLVSTLAVGNVAVWAAIEFAWRTGSSPADAWTLRMYLASALLLLDNLCVIWWYAHLTKQQKEAAQKQLELAGKQLALSGKDYVERNKPVVYSDRWEDPERTGNFHYVIRNVGGGFAVNVYFIGGLLGSCGGQVHEDDAVDANAEFSGRRRRPS